MRSCQLFSVALVALSMLGCMQPGQTAIKGSDQALMQAIQAPQAGFAKQAR